MQKTSWRRGNRNHQEHEHKHKDISDFAFKQIKVNENDRILDIGCGGGINIEKFLKLTINDVDGLDYSEISVGESIKHNQKEVDNDRCHVMQANVCDMPIDDETYDIVSAFETIYFWPDIADTFKEVSRIIKKNGKFMIAQGTDGNHPDDEKWLRTVEGMHVYTKNELEKYLLDAGFYRVDSYKKENDYILVVIAYK